MHVCDEGGPGFVNVSVRTITHARRVGVRLAFIDTPRSAQMTHSRRENEQDHGFAKLLKQRKVEDAKRICRIVHANAKSKGRSHVQKEIGRLMHHDEQELQSVWEGWHWEARSGTLRPGKT